MRCRCVRSSGGVVVKLLASGERGPGFDSHFRRAATIPEIGYLLPCRYIAEISLKRRNSSKQPTTQPSDVVVVIPSTQLQQPVLARVTT